MAVLGIGIALCLSSYRLFTALLAPFRPGIAMNAYSTVGVAQSDGEITPIQWREFEELRASKNDNILLAASTSSIEVGTRAGGNAARLHVEVVSPEYFSVLGVRILSGREIARNEENSNTHVAVITEDLARQKFGSASDVLQQVIEVEGVTFRIVGVAAAPFKGALASDTSIWLPPSATIPVLARLPQGYAGSLTGLYRNSDLWAHINAFYVISRTRDNLAMTQLLPESNSLKAKGMMLKALPGLEIDEVHRAQLIGWTKLAFLLSIALLLIAALNFGAFLASQIPKRRNEIQIRRMLGADFRRLCWDILRFPITLIGVATMLGVIVAACLQQAIPKLSFFATRHIMVDKPLQWADLGFFVILSLSVLLIIGALPVTELFKGERADSSHSRLTSNSGTRRLLLGVVGFQSAVSLISVLSALLLIKCLQNWKHIDLGFRSSSVAVAQLGPEPNGSVVITARSSGDFELATLSRLAIQKLETFPGIQNVAMADGVPLSYRPLFTKVIREDGTKLQAQYNAVTQGFFQTLGIPLLDGRSFSSNSLTGKPDEAIVNAALARLLWPDGKAIGKTINVPISPDGDISEDLGPPLTPVRIVGVAADAQYDGPGRQIRPMLYLRLSGSYLSQLPMFVIHGTMNSAALDAVIRDAFGNSIAGLTVAKSFEMRQLFEQSFESEQMRATLASGAAVVLMLLALIGAYSITGFHVTSRERELAIRICLGASRSSVVIAVWRETFYAALASIASAYSIWTLWDKVLGQYLNGLNAWDVAVWAAGILIWFVALMLASGVPALKLLNLQPGALLKAE
jgi:putative ABC transport system permease protein